jgi:propionyl-CoA synthetase
VPVVDHWWQTETGWPIAGNPLGIQRLPTKHGSTTRALPGWDVRCVDAEGVEVPRGEAGSIILKLPLAPGALMTLWDADERFVQSYFTTYPGFYASGDAGYIDEDDYIFIMARIDDVINVAGHRLSTGAMEEVLASHADVAECAVIGVADALKGQVPMGLVVLNHHVARSRDEIVAEMRTTGARQDRPGRLLPAGRRRRPLPRPAQGRPCAPPGRRSPNAATGRCRRPSRRSARLWW